MPSDPFQEVSKSTLQIYSGPYTGDGRGSGFHFLNTNIVVTNAHVIVPSAGETISARTESGQDSELELLAHSSIPDEGGYESSGPDESGYDYAILRVKDDLGSDRVALQPAENEPEVGKTTCFAGYPHGINDLLVHQARISGHGADDTFYLDGSVNPGNSGGPIVDLDSGEVLGIVTYRRFMTPEPLDSLQQEWSLVSRAAERGDDISESGINIQALASLTASSFRNIYTAIEANANAGIGIGQRIQHVRDEIDDSVDLDES